MKKSIRTSVRQKRTLHARILCVCIGNSDRSPLMAAILQLLLRLAGWKVVCESAGISTTAKNGAPVPPHAVAAGARIGIKSLAKHKRRYIGDIDPVVLKDYDLVVCADSNVVEAVVTKHGVDPKKVYNAMVANPWPVHFVQDYEPTAELIMAQMYRVIARYFSTPREHRFIAPGEKPPFQ